MLKKAGISDPDWLCYILQHHENEDGSGYPYGLSGQDIAQIAKIISLADRYCTCETGRKYHQPLLPPAVLACSSKTAKPLTRIWRRILSMNSACTRRAHTPA